DAEGQLLPRPEPPLVAGDEARDREHLALELYWQHEVAPRLLDPLGPPEQRAAPARGVVRLEQPGGRRGLLRGVVPSGDERRREEAGRGEPTVPARGRGEPVHALVRVQLLRAGQVAVGSLVAPALVRVEPDAAREGVGGAQVEVVAMLVRLPSVEPRSL